MLGLSGVHSEVFIINDDFLLPILNFFFLRFLHFFYHIISRYKDCLEKLLIRKSLRATEILLEDWFASIFWDKWWSSFHSCHFLLHCLYIRNLKIIDDTLRRFFRMLCKILIFNQIIESFFSFPAHLAIFFLFKFLFMLIYYGKRQT